jgi:glycosyltransferase involved in cell wall biosynthesis
MLETSSRMTIITVVKDDLIGIERTFYSLKSQRNYDFEWVVIDSSSDASIRNFIESIQFACIEISYSYQTPTGIYAAMNLGWKLAKHDYVLFLNAGDYLSSRASTDILISSINPIYCAIAFPVLSVSEFGIVYDITIPKIVRESERRVYAIMNHQGVMINRHHIRNVGGFDETLQFAADGKLLDSLATSGPFSIKSTALIAFVHGGISTSKHMEVWKEIATYRRVNLRSIKLHWFSFKTKMRSAAFELHSAKLLGFPIALVLKYRERQIVRTNSQITLYIDLLTPH